MSSTLTNHLYHIIFSRKNRENYIKPDFECELFSYIAGIFKGENGKLICAGGTENHVHLLGLIHQSISVSDMVRRIKGNSSHWINKQKKLSVGFAWQKGYASFTVSESSKKMIKNYIKNQKQHHKTQSFKEEFIAFLHKHYIQFDDEYIWQ